jgi:hypothetical protein
MSYQSVVISVGYKQLDWFRKRNQIPVTVQINQQSAIFADKRYDLHPQQDGWTAISKMMGSLRMVIGEFNKDTVRKIISKNADRECRVIRAAALNVGYDCPRGYRVSKYSVVHPGSCWETWKEQNPKEPARILKTISIHNNDDLCPVCEEGFQ